MEDSIFSRLPPQLLALVLARLQPEERLGSMARVCSAWRAAAVMATNSISATGRTSVGLGRDSLNALFGWLQAYAAAAGLDSLRVKSRYRNRDPLTLPIQQLASLRSLDLENLTVTVQGQADTQAAATHLPPELSAVTHLRLWGCGNNLSTLPAFTNLQHLVLGISSSSSSSPEVANLMQLTLLHLNGACAQDAVLAPVGGMTRLQELQVVGTSYTAASFTALPVSLTKLCIRLEPSRPAPIMVLAPETTPAFAALTALRWLQVEGVTGFSAVLLRDMSSLQHLAVLGTPLLAAAAAAAPAGGGEQEEPRGVGLAVLSRMTQLQHLELPQTPAQLAGALTADEVAALTASSHLTSLIISQGLVQQWQYHRMFCTERRLASGRSKTLYLPHLKELRAAMGLLSSPEVASALVRRCPNLEQLNLETAMPDEEVLEVYDEYEGGDWCSAGVLSQLRSLTRLAVNVQGDEGTEAFWCGMANLKMLRELYVREVDISHFGGIMALVGCIRLTSLRVEFKQEIADEPATFEMETLQGQPPDIWRKLPDKALAAALLNYREAPSFDWDVQGALRSMSKAAAEHSLLLEREVRELRDTVECLEGEQEEQEDKQDTQEGEISDLQREVEDLQTEVADLKGQVTDLEGEVEDLQEQVTDLQGEVGDLRAMVVALGAQVHALQQQQQQ